MSDIEQVAKQGKPDAAKLAATVESVGYDRLSSQMRRLQNLLILVLAACLVVSACLNLYMVPANLVYQKRVNKLTEEKVHYAAIYRVGQRLVMDLQYLSRTNPGAQQLLNRHAEELSKYFGGPPRQSAP